MSAATVLHHIVSSLNSPAMIELCKVTGHKVSIVHRQDGRVRFVLVGRGYVSPSFGTMRELSQFCEQVLSGFTVRSL